MQEFANTITKKPQVRTKIIFKKDNRENREIRLINVLDTDLSITYN